MPHSTLFCGSVLLKYKMMNCKKVVSMIPAYLEDSLDAKDLQAFLEHIDNCADCSEELSIQFLITEGLSTLSTGDSYDLQTARTDKVRESHRDINVHNRLVMVRNIGVGLVVLMTIIAIACVYLVFFR